MATKAITDESFENDVISEFRFHGKRKRYI